jgi:predicted phosphoadenosine phosphosulfate sulfurtransferase
MPERRYLGMSVLQAARQRIAWTFDTFPRVYVSFSGGKDSGVMLHLVMDEAIKRGRQVGVLFVDLEGQYKLTIDYIQAMYDLYAEYIEPFWTSLPISLRNAVSVYEPKWTAWEPGREADWIRHPPKMAITLNNHPFDFYHYVPGLRAMEFEEFVPAFGDWYSRQGGKEQPTACFVGIRTVESLNRWRTIAGHGQKFKGRNWTNHVMKAVWNIYPIYDWSTEDIWIYPGKFNRLYNRLYDRMHQAGLTLHQARICQPYGDDQRRGLWLFHVIEPDTWARIIARVNGANQGALYANEAGNILGRIKIDKPEGHTWESFAMLLLGSMPPAMADHYKDKIANFIHWYADRGPMYYLSDDDLEDGEVIAFVEQWRGGYGGLLPDEAPSILESKKRVPSWRRVCKMLLRNDYWAKGLGFSQQQSGSAHQQYKRLMAKRRSEWNIFPSPG